MYAPPESKSAKAARKAAPARRAEPDPGSSLAARAASLNSRPQIRQLKEKEESLGGRPEIRALAAKTEPNRTGLPDGLKAGVEGLSGIALDDVRVHYGSSKPAALQAKAFAQGSEIHVAPGEERHLPHEAWHVVQQKQGRVKATVQAKGVPINDDDGLEREADVMGARASSAAPPASQASRSARKQQSSAVVQRVLTVDDLDYGDLKDVTDKAFQPPKKDKALVESKLQEWAREELLPETENPHKFKNWPSAIAKAREAVKGDVKSGSSKEAAETLTVKVSPAILSSATAQETPTSTNREGDEDRRSVKTKKEPRERRAVVKSSGDEEEVGGEEIALEAEKQAESGTFAASSAGGKGSLRHFKSDKETAGPSLKGGMLADDTGKKLSKNESKAAFQSLGIGDHVGAGHIGISKQTLKSQALMKKKGNFSWTNQETFLNAWEVGQTRFKEMGEKTKVVVVDLPDGAGYSIVLGTDENLYEVVPRRARIVRKKMGDFKTAYGIAEEKDPTKFDTAYHSHVLLK